MRSVAAVGIAAGLYLSMALGQGKSIIDGRPTVWLRYITWFLSTPLLILDLTFLGRTSLPITGSLLGANTYMIVTGFVATISANNFLLSNWVETLISCRLKQRQLVKFSQSDRRKISS